MHQNPQLTPKAAAHYAYRSVYLRTADQHHSHMTLAIRFVHDLILSSRKADYNLTAACMIAILQTVKAH